MKRRVALIEFSIYDQFPLVSGYLHAYARTDPAVAETFEFVHYQKEVELVDYAETLNAIRALNAAIVCFSCYVWNMGLIKRLVRDLRQDPKIDTIILGGHQITNHIQGYVEPADHKIIVINGQGEIPFRAALQKLALEESIAGLRGISCYIDGQLWNGGEGEMLTNLDDIPSPFLGGQFDRMTHPITVFETNRGCPYKCTFCTWGGDTLSVTKFSLDRIKEELRWITKQSVFFIYLGDANWGMLNRDIEISDYIAQLKRDHGYPWMVFYAAAKNKPKGSVECIEKFHAGGVISSQALGIQSLNQETLELIDRKNIKNSSFIEMFDQLKERKIDSYCELIWPLPGETLDTLKSGFEQLIELGARTIIMYPAILINNARLTEQVDEHEMETLACDDWKSELKLVKKTKYADRTAVDAGFWFYYASFLLANCDLDKALLRYLAKTTGKGFGTIIWEFAEFLRSRVAKSAYARLIESIFKDEAHGSLMTIGKVAVHLTHEGRFAIQKEVFEFVVTTQLKDDPIRALAVSGLWAFSLPKLFANTVDDQAKIVEELDRLGRPRKQTFSSLATVNNRGQNVTFYIRSAVDIWREIAPFFSPQAVLDKVQRIEVRHPAPVYGYNPNARNKNLVYAHGMIERLTFVSANHTVQ